MDTFNLEDFERRIRKLSSMNEKKFSIILGNSIEDKLSDPLEIGYQEYLEISSSRKTDWKIFIPILGPALLFEPKEDRFPLSKKALEFFYEHEDTCIQIYAFYHSIPLASGLWYLIKNI